MKRVQPRKLGRIDSVGNNEKAKFGSGKLPVSETGAMQSIEVNSQLFDAETKDHQLEAENEFDLSSVSNSSPDTLPDSESSKSLTHDTIFSASAKSPIEDLAKDYSLSTSKDAKSISGKFSSPKEKSIKPSPSSSQKAAKNDIKLPKVLMEKREITETKSSKIKESTKLGSVTKRNVKEMATKSEFQPRHEFIELSAVAAMVEISKADDEIAI